MPSIKNSVILGLLAFSGNFKELATELSKHSTKRIYRSHGVRARANPMWLSTLFPVGI